MFGSSKSDTAKQFKGITSEGVSSTPVSLTDVFVLNEETKDKTGVS